MRNPALVGAWRVAVVLGIAGWLSGCGPAPVKPSAKAEAALAQASASPVKAESETKADKSAVGADSSANPAATKGEATKSEAAEEKKAVAESPQTKSPVAESPAKAPEPPAKSEAEPTKGADGPDSAAERDSDSHKEAEGESHGGEYRGKSRSSRSKYGYGRGEDSKGKAEFGSGRGFGPPGRTDESREKSERGSSSRSDESKDKAAASSSSRGEEPKEKGESKERGAPSSSGGMIDLGFGEPAGFGGSEGFGGFGPPRRSEESRGNSESAAEASSGRATAKAEKVRFQFRYQPWKDVLDWFARQADFSLVMEAPPPGTFNYTDEREYTPSEAIDLLNGVLATKGYTLIRRGRMLVVLNLEDGIPDPLVSLVPPEGLEAKGEFELVRVLFNLEKLRPEEAEAEVRKLLGPQGTVVSLAKSRQLQVTDTAGRVRAVRTVLMRLEDPTGSLATQVKFFDLKYNRPEQVIPILRQLFDIPEGKDVAADNSIRITIEQATGRLLVSGRPDRVARVADTLLSLEKPAPGQAALGPGESSPQLEVYSVTKVDPQAVMSVLQTLLAGQTDVRLAVDPKTGNLIAMARPYQQKTIRATLEQLQRDAQRVEVIQLTRVDPQSALAAITRLFGSGDPTKGTAPQVDADPTTRKLLIRGTDLQITEIRGLLEKLGEPSMSTSGPSAEPEKVRVIPLTGRAAQSALERMQEIWPKVHANKIRVVTPSAVIPSVRPSSSEPPAAGPAGAPPSGLPQELLDRLREVQPPREPDRSPRTGPSPLDRSSPPNPPAQEGLPGQPSRIGQSEVENRSAQEHRPRRLFGGASVIFAGESREVPQDPPKGASELPQPAPEASKLPPESAKPAPEAVKPALSPVAAKPAPSVEIAKPAPEAAKSAPAPEAVKPVPAPEAVKPTPEAVKPAPEAVKPAPEAVKPAPEAVKPTPEAVKPAPEAVKPAPAKPSVGAGSPIVVTVMPGGIMIASEDTAALDEFERMLGTLAEGTLVGNQEITVIYLKHAKAAPAAEMIEQVLSGASARSGFTGAAPATPPGAAAGMASLASRFATTGATKITPDARLNALLVQANPVDLDTIEQLVKVIDQPESPEVVAVMPKPRLIPVMNMQAQEVATIVRQVYANQMEGAGGGGQGQGPTNPAEMMMMMRGMRGGGGSGGGGPGGMMGPMAAMMGGRGGRQGRQDDTPKMSVGVDSRSNSLIVAAKDQLFQEIQQLVQQLDEAAGEQEQKTALVSLHGISPDAVRQALSSIGGASVQFNSGASGTPGSSMQPGGMGQNPWSSRRRYGSGGFGSGGFGGGGFGGGFPGFGGGFGGPGMMGGGAPGMQPSSSSTQSPYRSRSSRGSGQGRRSSGG